MISTHSRLWLSVLTAEQHARTCGYWYTITERVSPHTAFATKAGLLLWMNERGLSLSRSLTEPGVSSWQELLGAFRNEMHFSPEEVARFDEIRPLLESRAMDNAQWVEAKITADPDGLRTVHILNPNVSRHVFDDAESRRLME